MRRKCIVWSLICALILVMGGSALASENGELPLATMTQDTLLAWYRAFAPNAVFSYGETTEHLYYEEGLQVDLITWPESENISELTIWPGSAPEDVRNYILNNVLSALATWSDDMPYLDAIPAIESGETFLFIDDEEAYGLLDLEDGEMLDIQYFTYDQGLPLTRDELLDVIGASGWEPFYSEVSRRYEIAEHPSNTYMILDLNDADQLSTLMLLVQSENLDETFILMTEALYTLGGDEEMEAVSLLSENLGNMEEYSYVQLKDYPNPISLFYSEDQNYELSFTIDDSPSNTRANFFDGTLSAGIRAEAEPATPVETTPSITVESVFAGIDTTAQIEPTVLWDDNRMTITAESLEYGLEYGEGSVFVNLLMEAKTEDPLPNVSISVASVNRMDPDSLWFDRVWNGSRTLTPGENQMHIPLWDFTAREPGFAGISCMDLRLYMDGESSTTRVYTSLTEIPRDAAPLLSSADIDIYLTQEYEVSDRGDRVTWQLEVDNRASQVRIVITDSNDQWVNDFTAPYAITIWDYPYISSDSRGIIPLTIWLDQLADQCITDVSQIRSLDFALACVDENQNTVLLQDVIHLTGVMLPWWDGQEEEPATDATAMDPVLLYEKDGVLLWEMGISGNAVELMMENNTEEDAYLYLDNYRINGWQMSSGSTDLSTSAGSSYRVKKDLSENVPNFQGYASITLDVTPCVLSPEWGAFVREGDPLTVDLTIPDPAEVIYPDEDYPVLLEQDGVTFRYVGIESNEKDLRLRLEVINDTDTRVWAYDMIDPRIGYAPTQYTVNNLPTYEGSSILYDTHTDPHLRSFAQIVIHDSALEEMGITAGQVETIDLTIGLFRLDQKGEYVSLPLHIDVQ